MTGGSVIYDEAPQPLRAACRQADAGSSGPNAAVPGGTYWAVFECQDLRPALDGVEPPP